MKRFLSVLLAVSIAMLATPREAKGYALLTAQTTTGSSTEISTAKATSIRVHIWDTAGTGTSTTLIKVRNVSDGSTYYTVATVTDPTTSGELWIGSGADFVLVTVSSCTNCSISATISAYTGSQQIIQ